MAGCKSCKHSRTSKRGKQMFGKGKHRSKPGVWRAYFLTHSHLCQVLLWSCSKEKFTFRGNLEFWKRDDDVFVSQQQTSSKRSILGFSLSQKQLRNWAFSSVLYIGFLWFSHVSHEINEPTCLKEGSLKKSLSVFHEISRYITEEAKVFILFVAFLFSAALLSSAKSGFVLVVMLLLDAGP